jgi:hypothetical protein
MSLPTRYEYEVVYDVPLPDPNWRVSAEWADHCIYPWPKMQVGGSFMVGDRNPRSVASAVAQRNREHRDQWFTLRVCPTGVRVWRAR